MEHPALMKMAELARGSDAREATIQYLTDQLHFIKKGESVLILLSANDPERVGALFTQAVLRREGVPVFWQGDMRWKTLLRITFANRVSTIIGPPLLVLGISKLAKHTATPLYIRNVVTAGYPCLDWMIDGMIKGLDCRTWGCFEPGAGMVVSGFSCGKSRGVHLREDVYGVDIVDEAGNLLPDGQIGDIVLYPKADPSLRYYLMDRGRLEYAPCKCGNPAPRLMDICHGRDIDKDVAEIAQQLISWTSILDCSVRKGDYGLELELQVFPGEKLPQLPSCAKQVIYPWDPEKSEPFMYSPKLINPIF